MEKLSPSCSPCLSSDSLNDNRTPPPLPNQISPEISKFHQQNNIDLGFNKNPQSFTQTPTQNNKNPFGIEALLAKNQSDLGPCTDESDEQVYMKRKYKEHVISRNLNDSPDEITSR